MSHNIPKFFQALQERHTAFFEAVEALGQVLREAGPVDTSAARRLQLAAAVAIRPARHEVRTVPRGLYR